MIRAKKVRLRPTKEQEKNCGNQAGQLAGYLTGH